MRHDVWRLPAIPSSVAAARQAVGAFAESAGADEDAVGEIVLCISEATTNAVVHAYGDAPGEIVIEAFDRDGTLTIHVRDFGVGMRPHAESSGAGVGLSVIAQLASVLTTGPTNEDRRGTELVMRFDLAADQRRAVDQPWGRPPADA